MGNVNLFTPGPTINVAATASSLRTALPTGSFRTVRIKNVSATNIAFVALGDATIVATTTASMPIGLGETVGITRSAGQTHAAAICSTDVATVYFTIGDGE